MIVRKLVSSEKKRIEERPPYQKPVYKSYRELLQLDRPRRKMSYESSQSEEDFLQKLLKQENKKSKRKKKKESRKNTSQNETRARKETTQNKKSMGKEKEKESKEEERKKPKVLSEIQQFLAQTQELGHPAKPNPEENKPQSKEKTVRPVLSKSAQRLPQMQSYEKSKITKKSVILNNPIFIDTKSIENPPILYSSASKMFTTTMPRKQGEGYHELIKQRANSNALRKGKEVLNLKSGNEGIEFEIQKKLDGNFNFEPNIKPLYPHWRLSLTLNPLQGQPVHKYKDHDTLFKSAEEQQRFVRSLRELSYLKR